jgi:aspartyl/asparaginyl beta-hydroxylase (cupin superfamily)
MGLITPDGDPAQTYLKRGQKPRKTPVLLAMPYLESIIDGLGVPVKSAGVSVMLPGARVRWHRDTSHSVDGSLVRFHLPVATHPSATLEIAHELTCWAAGTLYYGDFTFPHRVAHDGPEPRIHIMIDTQAKAARQLFSETYLAAAQRRARARNIAATIFDFTEKLHPAGWHARRHREQRNEMVKNG